MKIIHAGLFVLLWSCATTVRSFSPRLVARLTSKNMMAPIITSRSRSPPRLAVVSSDAADANVTSSIQSSTTNEEESIDATVPLVVSTNSTMTTSRWRNSIPRLRGDELDREILTTSIPSMVNLAVVPIVNSVDTFWVGRMGVALALAGQAAANQAFFTLYFLVSFLPTITAPLVAKAVGSGNTKAAQARVCESLFLCNVLGVVGTLVLVLMPRTSLGMVLQQDAPAMAYAAPYLRFRALSMIPALCSATGFAAYRGLLNTVTPLKVSLTTNAINLVLDPLLIFKTSMGFVGAALATAIAETASGVIYLKLLFKRKLVRWSMILKPPSWKALLPLLQGGAAMLFRQAALNIGFLAAGRRAQAMDPSGVSAAAYGIVMQIYTVGIVVHVAVQQTAAALVPAALCQSGDDAARQVADRIFVWGGIIGFLLGVAQYLALPLLVPIFSTLESVQEAVKSPALVASLIQIINGAVFAGEGAIFTTVLILVKCMLTTPTAHIHSMRFSSFLPLQESCLEWVLIKT